MTDDEKIAKYEWYSSQIKFHADKKTIKWHGSQARFYRKMRGRIPGIFSVVVGIAIRKHSAQIAQSVAGYNSLLCHLTRSKVDKVRPDHG